MGTIGDPSAIVPKNVTNSIFKTPIELRQGGHASQKNSRLFD